MKFDQGHRNSHVNITFKGGYPEAKLERSRLKRVQAGPKIKVFVEFVKAYLTTLPYARQTHEKQFAVIR